jgi:hypothetical protein
MGGLSRLSLTFCIFLQGILAKYGDMLPIPLERHLRCNSVCCHRITPGYDRDENSAGSDTK